MQTVLRSGVVETMLVEEAEYSAGQPVVEMASFLKEGEVVGPIDPSHNPANDHPRKPPSSLVGEYWTQLPLKGQVLQQNVILCKGMVDTVALTMSHFSYLTLLPALHASGHAPTDAVGSKLGLDVGEIDPS